MNSTRIFIDFDVFNNEIKSDSKSFYFPLILNTQITLDPKESQVFDCIKLVGMLYAI